MSLPHSHFYWPTSVEPDSLSTEFDDFTLLTDDLALNKGIYASLPLSLIQQDKHFTYNGFQQQLSPQLDQFSFGETQVVPSFVKTEAEMSPPYSPPESPGKPSKAELASKLLNELDSLKDEPYSNWMEEKIEFPAFEQVYEPIPQPDNTQSLLLEFESVCQQPKYQLNHLTPPQSPPLQQNQLAQCGWIQHPANFVTPVPTAVPVTNWQQDIAFDQPIQLNVDHELAVVDALVKRRAEDIDGTFESDIQSIPSPESDSYQLDYPPHAPLQQQEDSCEYVSPLVPAASEHAYAKSTEESLLYEPGSPNSSSSSSSVCGSSEFDDEWAPSSASEAGSIVKQRSYNRPKPYSRNSDDKKSRKKEQNKNAATRYRQKKKQEVEVLANEEKILKDKNTQLRTKCSDIQREVKYLKSLMRELCKAKGLIK